MQRVYLNKESMFLYTSIIYMVLIDLSRQYIWAFIFPLYEQGCMPLQSYFAVDDSDIVQVKGKVE